MTHLWEVRHDDGAQPSQDEIDVALMQVGAKVHAATHPTMWFDNIAHMSDFFHGRGAFEVRHRAYVPVQWTWTVTSNPEATEDVLSVIMWEVRMHRPVTFSCEVSQITDEPAARQLLQEMGAATADQWQTGGA